MTTKKPQYAILVLERLKKAYNMKYDTEVADFLGKDASTISTWKRRGTIDYATIFSKCSDLNANFIIHGDMPIFRKGLLASTSSNLIGEPKGGYQGENIIESIESLSVNPEEKMKLLEIYLKILEQKEQE
ncbi:MAG: helix-turn-helix domain-containing protein [Balneolaceae bacterium]